MEKSLMPAFLLIVLLAGCLSYNLDGVPLFDDQYERRDIGSDYVPHDDPSSRSIEEYLLGGRDQYEHQIRDSDIPYYDRQFDDDYRGPTHGESSLVEVYEEGDDADHNDAKNRDSPKYKLPSEIEDKKHINKGSHLGDASAQDVHKKQSYIVNNRPGNDARKKIQQPLIKKNDPHLHSKGKSKIHKKEALDTVSKNRMPLKEANDKVFKSLDQPAKNKIQKDSHVPNIEYVKVDDTKGNIHGIKLDSSSVPRANNTAGSTAQRVGGPHVEKISNKKDNQKLDGYLFYVVIAACSVAGVAGLVLAGYCWYRLRKETDESNEVEYTIGKDGKNKKGMREKEKELEKSTDEKLAQSAEVYHYMHAKKQLSTLEQPGSQSKIESDSSDEESDNTVYECPGLAPPGDMRVVNPLFSDHEGHASDHKSEGSYHSSPTRRTSGSRRSPPSDFSKK